MGTATTGLVLTLNGAAHVDDTLSSLSFCDELLVVDSGSTDETLDIAKKHGATVLYNKWEGPEKQFRFAFEHVKTPWLVSLDQDEILSGILRQNIIKNLENTEGLSGLYCPRASFYFDRFLKHSGWYPDYLLRVFDLKRMELRVTPPHYGFRPLGPTKKLQGDIIHYPYANLSEHFQKINYYTQCAAEDLAEQGKSSGLFIALAHGTARFAKQYIFKAGFLDGRAGFILAVHSFLYGFQKYIRISELKLKDEKPSGKAG